MNKLTIEKLISYVESITADTVPIKPLNNGFLDTLTFKTINYGDIVPINDFPNDIKTIFEPYLNSVKRYGVYESHTLYHSILMCICEKFYSKLDEINRKKLLEAFQEHLLGSIGENEENGEDIRKSVQKFEYNKIVLLYLSKYLNLNIFLINIIEDKIHLIYSDEYFVQYKNNVFLVYNNNIFEPLAINDTKLVNYKNIVFKKVINVHKKDLIIMSLNPSIVKSFEMKPDDLTKYIKKNIEIIPSIQLDPIPSPDPEPIISPTPSIPRLHSKMKIETLQNIAKELGIDISFGTFNNGKLKYKSKETLISEIKNLQ